MTASHKNILICVCGGIAAYKVCHIVSRLTQLEYHVEVAMTAHAMKFVGALTFEALSGRPVHTDLSENSGTQDPHHIQLAQNAALVLVAPATANIIGKITHGLADDLISTLLLATGPEKVLLAPAMNEQMWNNPAVQDNIALLRRRNVTMIGPESGWQACRTMGMGRMSEPDAIVEAITARVPAR